jgi:putative ABC transport system permease protein
MTRLGRALALARDPEQHEKELDAELLFDFEERVAAKLRSGLSEPEARRAARVEFGGHEQVKEECREVRTFLWVQQFSQDILYGTRMLFHNPGFAVAAILSLGLGIGANTTIFSLLNTILLRPLDYQDPGRLVAIRSIPKERPGEPTLSNAWSYLAWKKRAESFASMGSFFSFVSSLGAGENGAPAERIHGQFVSASLFAALGVSPRLGRTFTEAEGAPLTYAPVALISDRLWERRYALDPHILGRTMELDGARTTIIGVMPKGFNLFEDDSDYWAVSGVTRQRLESSEGRVAVVGRLKPGVSLEQAQSEMDAIAAQLSKDDPAHNNGNGVSVQPLQESFLGTFRTPLLLLQGAVAFVLLIACANVAGLLLARGAGRQTEVAVRSAMGAGRWRIVRQLLTESIILSLAGGALGIALAFGGLHLFIANAPPGFPRLNELRLDLPVLAFTAAIALITGMVFGLVPAMQLSRPDLIEGLKAATRGVGTTLIRQRFRASLVTFQIALALMLLIGAGLMINSFLRIQANELGMDPDGLIEFQFRYPALQVLKPIGKFRNNGLYDVNPTVTMTVGRMVERLGHIPGALSVAASSSSIGGALEMNFRLPGQGTQASAVPHALYLAITPNFFATLKTPILRGRDFNDRDDGSGVRVAIVNEALAKLYWPDKDPLGQTITIDYLPNDPPRKIIAIVSDVRLTRTQQEARPMMYVPLSQQGPQWIGPSLGTRSGAFFVMRARPSLNRPLSLIPDARKALAEIDPSQPLANIETVEATLSDKVQFTRLYMLLLGVFGCAAAILAAVGIYGVMSFSIAQRRREIGIRMALGADHGTILRLVGRQALSMIGLGLLLGLAGAFALTRVLEFALWNVRPTDPLTFSAVSLFLVLIALGACVAPTLEATRVDPAVAVRVE